MTAAPTTADRERLAAALEIVALVEDSFPSSRFTDENRRQYAADVVHLDPDEARAAVEVLKRSGRDFAPPAGDVAREVARLQIGAPDWADVKRSLIRRNDAVERSRSEAVAWECPHGKCDGSGFVDISTPELPNTVTDCECRPARSASLRVADELHPLVREFIEEDFVTWGEIDTVGQGGRDAATVESQMRVKWQTFANRAVESRAIAMIEGPPSLRRLEQARAEDGPRRNREAKHLGSAVDRVVAALPRAS